MMASASTAWPCPTNNDDGARPAAIEASAFHAARTSRSVTTSASPVGQSDSSLTSSPGISATSRCAIELSLASICAKARGNAAHE